MIPVIPWYVTLVAIVGVLFLILLAQGRLPAHFAAGTPVLSFAALGREARLRPISSGARDATRNLVNLGRPAR